MCVWMCVCARVCMCSVFVGVETAVPETGFKLNHAVSVVEETFTPNLTKSSSHITSSIRISSSFAHHCPGISFLPPAEVQRDPL